MRPQWRTFCRRSRAKARRSTTSRSRNQRLRTCSLAWSGGASNERRDACRTFGIVAPSATESQGGRRERLPAGDWREPRALVGLFRGSPPSPRHRRERLHLPGARESRPPGPGAHGGAESRDDCGDERPNRWRRARGHDDRVLAQCSLVDGLPALLGKGDREPPAVHDGADVSHGPPRRDGSRRDVHDVRPRDDDARRWRGGVLRHLAGHEPVPRPCCLLRDPHRPVRNGDGARLALSPLGSRGVASVRAPRGAGLLRERLQIPGGGGRWGGGGGGGGGVIWGGCFPAVGPPPPRPVPPPLPRNAGAAGREVNLTASVGALSSTARIHWRTFKVAAWLGWQMDSNWTEPWLFAVYSGVKPVAGGGLFVP